MPDFIYAIETRLTPEQQRALAAVTEAARAQEMNVYLTGGTIRDLVTGFPIRDLDFTVQGNVLKLQKDLERAGASITGTDEDLKVLYVTLPGNVRAEVSMARSETYDKPGKAPVVAAATINEDLRRRDFTVNAMALSLNPGSRGLLLDPFNGMADIESKVIRILHNYAFLEDPSRLIRATRFAARFHWPLEERTQARYDAAKENNYIEYISNKAIGYEIEQLAYEEDPLHILRALEKEDWLKVLNPHWSVAKVDNAGLAQLTKLRQQMVDLGYTPDTAPVVLYFLTRRLSDKDSADIRKLIPRKDLVEAWKHLEEDAKDLAKKLTGKESATPSRTWQLLSQVRPELILFLELTSKQQAVTQKISNFFGKWRQVRQKLPLPEMIEMRITPALPEYPKIAEEAFLLMLDGKLRSRTEIVKFLKPYEPPPPPPPPPARRGRGAKAAAAGAGVGGPAGPGRKRRPRIQEEEELPEDEVEQLHKSIGRDEDEEEELEELDELGLGEDEEKEEEEEIGEEEEEPRPAKKAPAKAVKKKEPPKPVPPPKPAVPAKAPARAAKAAHGAKAPAHAAKAPAKKAAVKKPVPPAKKAAKKKGR
ncbi:MAG TPA: CCA tRNA nucleotidyltransferase [Terriglobales bacterium]|nr:CCA tRNA nucleotidyltransferase [Terriglobales bacterium]